MPRREAEPVEVTLEVLGESELAFRLAAGDSICWIAKSLITNLDQLDPDIGDTLEFEIPDWLAKKEGFI